MSVTPERLIARGLPASLSRDSDTVAAFERAEALLNEKIQQSNEVLLVRAFFAGMTHAFNKTSAALQPRTLYDNDVNCARCGDTVRVTSTVPLDPLRHHVCDDCMAMDRDEARRG